MTTESKISPLGQAMGRIPSGLYILTARNGDRATGILASWVQQAGFDPPSVTVAVAHQRHVRDWIGSSGRFTLSQLPVGSKHLLRHFAKGFDPEASAFEGVSIREEARGGPILSEAVAFLDAEVVGVVDSADHRVFLAKVIGGAMIDLQSEPFVHIRGNGLHY